MSYYTLTKEGIRTKGLNLAHTIESAQPLTFHADYDLKNGTISYFNGSEMIFARFSKSTDPCDIRILSKNKVSGRDEFVRRFRMSDDMTDIYAAINTDPFMNSAIQKYYGMRITLNDPWETTLCFIASQYNNVKRIRKMVLSIMERYGQPVYDDKHKIVGRSFPSSQILAKASESDLRKYCGTGFRAKYMVNAAEYCANNLDLYSLTSKSYDRVKEELMEISGVGDKVADCIALMGYGKMDAFPIDVWVKRTMENVYFKGKDKKIKELHKFAERKWGKYQAYAQQYLFWNGRNTNWSLQ